MKAPGSDNNEYPDVTGPVVALGFALMIEGILIFIASIPLVFFARVGIRDLIGGAR